MDVVGNDVEDDEVKDETERNDKRPLVQTVQASGSRSGRAVAMVTSTGGLLEEESSPFL